MAWLKSEFRGACLRFGEGVCHQAIGNCSAKMKKRKKAKRSRPTIQCHVSAEGIASKVQLG